jgi:multidrug efflux pump subunit AcrA (membrane-fusion protein)
MEKIKNIGIIFLMLIVILIVGCNTSEIEYNNENIPDNTPENNNILPENIVEDTSINPITGNVVAIVNDEKIKSDSIEEIQQLFVMQGQQISEQEALEQLINQKILEQKIQKENIIVTNKEAEDIIEKQLAMQGATLEDYKQQIITQGISYEEELENIKNQIATQIYLESLIENQLFNVTEEEAKEFYDMYKAQSPEEIPSYEELKPEIILALKQQKQQEAINNIILELRSNANVEYK